MYGYRSRSASVTPSNSSFDWVDGVRRDRGAIYVEIVRALEQAIRSGLLQPGDRLPPQRSVAARLGVDLTTVTRAYAMAQARGLADAAVGRGTFVRAPSSEDEAGLVDLSMNLPPPPDRMSLGAMLRDTTAAILDRSDPSVLMAYHPGFGGVGQRAAGAQWLAPCLGKTDPDRLLVAPGAQAALAAVLAAVCRAGDTVIAEPLTYPGLLGVANRLGLKVVACPTDEQGVRLDTLEALCAHHDARAVYLVPTFQNPTATSMPLARREAVARIARAAGTWIVEDDPYSRLLASPLPAIGALAPDRTFYIATLSKTLTPGLRIAYLACPPDWTEPLASMLRANVLMPPPLMAAIATRWIQEGTAEALLTGVRSEARTRRAMAAEWLPDAEGSAESIHVWLPLANERASERLRSAAQDRGLALVTAEAFAVDPEHRHGARISFGGPSTRGLLEKALKAVSELVGAGAPSGRTIV
jgi:DNA-binding transcriptional MocR family regulator